MEDENGIRNWGDLRQPGVDVGPLSSRNVTVQAPAGQRSKLRRLGWDPKACIEDTRWHCTHPHWFAVWSLRRPLHSRASVVCGDKHEETRSHSGRTDSAFRDRTAGSNIGAGFSLRQQCQLAIRRTVCFTGPHCHFPAALAGPQMAAANEEGASAHDVSSTCRGPNASTETPTFQPCETRPHAFRMLPHSNH